MSYFFVIPAFNPDAQLLRVLHDFLQIPKVCLCVIDDGSQDSHIFKDPLFKDRRVILLRHALNLGKGAALKTAFNHLLLNFPALKGVVTLDADGQHTVEDALKIVKKLNSSRDLVLGTRSFSFSDKSIPWRSRIGNILTRGVWQLFVGARIADTQTGLRGVPASLMKECLHLLPNRYEFETEMLLKAHELGVPIVEVPIQTIYIEQNRRSHFNPFFDSLKIYFVLFRFLFSSLLATILDYLAFYIFSSFLKIGLSFALARLISFVFNYQVNRNFVFKRQKGGSKAFFKYVSLVILNVYIGYSFVETVCFKGMPALYAKISIDFVLLFFNFFAQREWVFRNKYTNDD